MSKSRKGFTLVELLVVIAIIALLASISLPALGSVREMARKTLCSSNIRQVALAMRTYHNQHQKIPMGVDMRQNATATGALGQWQLRGTTGFAMLLPFVDEQSVPYNYKVGNHEAGNKVAVGAIVGAYRCPSDGNDVPFTWSVNGINSYSRSNYAMCFGSKTYYASTTNGDTDGAFRVNGARALADFQDGETKTVLLSEVISGKDGNDSDGLMDTRGLWAFHNAGSALYTHKNTPNTTAGDAIYTDGTIKFCVVEPGMPCDYTGGTSFNNHHAAARSRHMGGVNVAFADGHAIFVSDVVDSTIWINSATIDAGEATNLE